MQKRRAWLDTAAIRDTHQVISLQEKSEGNIVERIWVERESRST